MVSGMALSFFLLRPEAQAGVIVQAPHYAGLQQGLLGYWSFNGGTVAGTHVYDASGNGNRGTMTNGPTLVNGKLGQGMRFDGSDDYVAVDDGGGLTLIPNYITVAFWVNFKDADNVNFPNPLTKQPVNQAYLFVIDSDNKPIWRIDVAGSGINRDAKDSVTTVALGTWEHWVGTSDGTISRFYRNGIEVATHSISGTLALPGVGNLEIGGVAGGSNAFKGLMDDVRIYNRALNADEIKRLYKIGATAKVGVASNTDSLQKGLVGYWNFDGDTVSGTHVYDQSGQGNRGIMTNGPTQTIGKLGQGMQFDGADDEVVTSTFDLGAINSITYNIWLKNDSASVTGTNGILWKRTNVFELFLTGNELRSWIANNDAWHMAARSSSTPVINWSEWHMVTAVYDGSRVRIYRDGVVVAVSGSETGNLPSSNDVLEIGDWSGGGLNNFDGLFDDIRIYNRALSADEIKRLYKIGATAKVGVAPNTDSLTKGLVGYWTFDGDDVVGAAPATQYAIDRSGNGGRGTLVDGPTRRIGKIGQGMKFGAGSSARIHIPDSSTNDYTGGDMTLSTWVYINTSEANRAFLISKAFNSSGYYNYILLFNQLGTCPANTFLVSLMVSNAEDYDLCSSVVTKGTWHHVAVTLASDKSVKIYVDGVLSGSGTHTITEWTPGNGVNQSRNLALGYVLDYASGQPESTDLGLDGMLDDVRIYNRALSADEIKRLYNMGR